MGNACRTGLGDKLPLLTLLLQVVKNFNGQTDHDEDERTDLVTKFPQKAA